MSDGPVQNTDRELYREDTDDPAGSYYENSVFVTEGGGIGMKVGGTVIVQPIADWHRQALAAHQRDLGMIEAESSGRVDAAEYAAQVLRAAAQEQRNEADQVPDTDQGSHADGHRCAAGFLDRRAAALNPAPPDGVS